MCIAQQVVNNMAFSVEKCVFLVKHYFKTVTTATDLLCSEWVKSVIFKSVKQFWHTGNVNASRQSASLYKSLWKAIQETGISYSHIAAKSMKLFPYNVRVIWRSLPLDCWKHHHCCEWLFAKVTLAWLFSDVMIPSCVLCEVTEYLHIVNRRYLCSSWNSLSLCQDWNVVCTLTMGLLSSFSLKTPLNLSTLGMLCEFLGHLTEEKIARQPNMSSSTSWLCELFQLFRDHITLKGLLCPCSLNFSPQEFLLGPR